MGEKTKRTNTPALVCSIIASVFCFLTSYYTVSSFRSSESIFARIGMGIYVVEIICQILYIVSFIGLGIFILARKKWVVFGFALGHLCVELCSFLYALYCGVSQNLFSVALALLSWVAFCIILVMTIKNHKAVRYIWFVPAALESLSFIISLYTTIVQDPKTFDENFISYINSLHVMTYLLIISFFVLAGLWMKYNIKQNTIQQLNPTEQMGNDTVVHNEPVAVPSPDAGARLIAEQNKPAADLSHGDARTRLSYIKELYDTGLITEDEYNDKRRQILEDI